MSSKRPRRFPIAASQDRDLPAALPAGSRLEPRHKRMRGVARRHLAGLLVLACASALNACGDSGREANPAPPSAVAKPAPEALGADSASMLRMTIDGVAWKAEHDIFGAVHPTGVDRSILIAGSRGGKNANEQAFNLNLLGIDAPGRYRVHGANATSGVAQMANLSPERYLAGNVFGYDIEVELVKFSKNPDRIEARFSGTLEANDGSTMRVSDGYFRYAE